MLVVEPAGLDDDACVAAWAASGAMHLTGEASGGAPSAAPAHIVRRLYGLGAAVAEATGRLGDSVTVDPVAIIAQRAAFTGFGRGGSRSVGGSAHMARTCDGWVALNLPRRCDVEALGALVGLSAGESTADPGGWVRIEAAMAATATAHLAETGALLGLAVAEPGATAVPDSPFSLLGAHLGSRRRKRRSGRHSERPLVVDLSGLWAGPLAAALLAEAGCDVVKVESISRPDGARRGPREFFEMLNAHKQHLRLDLPSADGIAQLRALIDQADVVIEASRPRVMHQWGIDPDEVVGSGTVWVSITGHGRSGAHRNRIAFGDDAAVAGGLVVAGDPPLFVGDAIADPIAGLTAAAAAGWLLAEERAGLVDVSLASAAAWTAGSGNPAIQRPVTRCDRRDHHEDRWFVESAGRSLEVCRPQVPAGLTTTLPLATVGSR